MSPSKIIVPNYFCQNKDKLITYNPVEFIQHNWEDRVNTMSIEELNIEASTMLMHQKACTKLAVEDLSIYTSTMATLLGVKIKTLGNESPVYDRNDWMESLMGDPSSIQLQKWIFAWIFIRNNFKKIGIQSKSPEEIFEERFLRMQGLKYDEKLLKNMKKNSKTSVRLLYNQKARNWRDHMFAQIKDRLGIVVSVTAPQEVRGSNKNFRRDPSTFIIGRMCNDKISWKEVKKY